MEPINIIELAIPLYFLFIFIELGVAYRQKKKLYRLNDTLTAMALGTISQFTGIFFKLVILGTYIYVEKNWAIQTWSSIASVPFGTPLTFAGGFQVHWAELVSWSVVFIAVDCCYYWAHRMCHESNILWAAHVVHHSSEEYNLSTALRQSSLQQMLTTGFYIPLALMGVPWQMFMLCYGLNLFYQFWIHTRMIDKMWGPFEWLMNTPSHHRVHHGVNPQYIDRNHAGVFMIWDRMFGTFEPEGEAVVYGITTPINSWNPMWANFHGYYDIYRDVVRSKSILDALGIIFRVPGWRPNYLGGPIKAKAITPETKPLYDPPVTMGLQLYCLAQFVLVILATLPALKASKEWPISYSLLVTGAVMISLTNIGAIFELRRWALIAEYARCVAMIAASPGFSYYAAINPTVGLSPLIGGLGVVLGIGSWYWLHRYKSHFNESLSVDTIPTATPVHA